MAKDVKLNVQGLARRDLKLMECLEFDEGYTGVSIDLSAGEPTVVSHYSQDKNYRYACFDGVGKEPYYKDGTLMIDDLYLMVMSRSPVTRDAMRKAFEETFNGLAFTEQWMENPEVIKEILKEPRALTKMLTLAIMYGMRPKKMVKQTYEKGHILPLKDAKEFYSEFWSTFKDVRKFANKLQMQIERKSWMVNPFGYRLVPEPHKAFNYFIQSSVSGIMHLFGIYLFKRAPYAEYITCIHDEFLVQVPDEKLEQFRKDKDLATEDLNKKLGWTVDVRTGFACGKNWYEAK